MYVCVWFKNIVQVHSSHCPVFPVPFAEETFVFPLDILSCVIKDYSAICLRAHFWVPYSFPMMSVSVFVPVPYCLDDCGFLIHHKLQNCNVTSFLFFFNMTLAIFGLFWFLTNFRVVCSSSLKNADVILIGVALYVLIALCSIDILTIFFLLIHEHGMFFHFFVSFSISFISVP